MLFCPEILRFIVVFGDMNLGINSSVLNGEKILGNKILMSAPNSFISKKRSFILLPSFEEPIEPKAEI